MPRYHYVHSGTRYSADSWYHHVPAGTFARFMRIYSSVGLTPKQCLESAIKDCKKIGDREWSKK